MSSVIPYFSAEDLHQSLNYPDLVQALKHGFSSDYLVPPRMHLHYPNGSGKEDNTLLVMPAVKSEEVAGVKVVTVAPENQALGMPSIQGVYYLMDAATGTPKALLEAKVLTNWRTAAASALASTYLSRESSSSLLMVGTGSLAPYLIQAHASVRPLERLYIWGRNIEKSSALAEEFSTRFEHVSIVADLKEAVRNVDIISVATLSTTPLIQGKWLNAGQHLDLVGAYKPDMREADDEVVRRSRIYVDNLAMAPKETGDLVIPLKQGIIKESNLQGDLFGLCQQQVKGRQTPEEITLFKSVGHALEDLVAAQLVMKKMN